MTILRRAAVPFGGRTLSPDGLRLTCKQKGVCGIAVGSIREGQAGAAKLKLKNSPRCVDTPRSRVYIPLIDAGRWCGTAPNNSSACRLQMSDLGRAFPSSLDVCTLWCRSARE